MSTNQRRNELQYFDALKRITKYQSVEKLRRDSEKDWGLSFEEALEYAYENVIAEAHREVKGKRRPKTKCKFGHDTCDGIDGTSGFICRDCIEAAEFDGQLKSEKKP
jgi:hypothetical protein